MPPCFLGEKLVARFLNGRLVKGYTFDFDPQRREFHVFRSREASGTPTRLLMRELKAVFAVRDFAGNPDRSKRKEFIPGDPVDGERIEVTFADGEVLLGTTRDYHPDAPGFLLVPADPRCNNLKAFVVAAAVRRVRRLASSARRLPEKPSGQRSPALPGRFLAWLRGGPADHPSRPALPAPAPSAPRVEAPRWPVLPRLLDVLVQGHLLAVDQAAEVAAEHRRTGDRISAVLARARVVDDSKALRFLSQKFGIPTIRVDQLDVPDDVVRLIKPELARRHLVLPVRRVAGTLVLATSDPTAVQGIDDVRFATGLHVICVLAPDAALQQAIERHYGDGAARIDEILQAEVSSGADALEVLERPAEKVDLSDLGSQAAEAPVTRLINAVLADAIRKRASDVHLEPDDGTFRVRFRIDGVLHDAMSLPAGVAPAAVSRVKVMANMDIAERRLPQDGRIAVRLGPRAVDIRASSLPTMAGEKIVLRVLDGSDAVLDLPKLGFEDDDLAQFKRAIREPHGMILVTGPTGSGKTTTLYAAISTINAPGINIVTAEDPVEYDLPRVNQIQVRDDIGLSFATLLRSILRQDPDVMLIGEMRDAETASMAIRAALTGHLVFSTLHTNDAPSTVTRLRDMGVAPYLVASSLLLVVAQRLCRRLCVECREAVDTPTGLLLDVGFQPDALTGLRIYRATGCKACDGTGYRGRTAIYELLEVTPELREAMVSERSAHELRERAVKAGMRTLRQAGLRKVAHGLTTIDEVLRVAAG